MPKIELHDLSDVSETLLLPLYYRALESRRPDAVLRDEKAEALVQQIDYDFEKLWRSFVQVTALMRARRIDEITRAFLAEYPGCAVVDIGCGLDTRFYRVDDGQVTWYDLDLPEVMAVRRKLLGDIPRCRSIACSAFDFAWMRNIDVPAGRAVLFLSEGVFSYFAEAEIKRLILKLRECFPGSELVFDGVPPFQVRLGRYHPALRRMKAYPRWGLRRGKDVEAWDPDIFMLDEWFYLDKPEPRLGLYQLMRWFPPMSKGFKVVHYRLGKRED